ncbi:MAG: hypothetical protein KGJ64_02925 [Betaproteobacteria bacterium]|nr:hypothetical protein [Betaproteobacteria bacterium]
MQAGKADYLRAAWPSFLVALPVSALWFALLEPAAGPWHGQASAWPPQVLYSLGFLLQWLACWAASALTLWLLARRPRGAGDVFEERGPDEQGDDA